MGFFLVFEGPEGSGKSTQSRLLAAALGEAGFHVVPTREPGGTTISESVRAILLDPDNYAMLAATEALLYAASRAQLVGQVIRPALEDGAVVVCDRFMDSSLAYQVGGRGLRFADVEGIQRLATGGLRPDLRILLDLPVDVGLARRFDDPLQVNRLDATDQAFHERVRIFYHDLATHDPEGWVVLDAEAPVSDLAARINEIVFARLRDHGKRVAHQGKFGGGE